MNSCEPAAYTRFKSRVILPLRNNNVHTCTYFVRKRVPCTVPCIFEIYMCTSVGRNTSSRRYLVSGPQTAFRLANARGEVSVICNLITRRKVVCAIGLGFSVHCASVQAQAIIGCDGVSYSITDHKAYLVKASKYLPLCCMYRKSCTHLICVNANQLCTHDLHHT